MQVVNGEGQVTAPFIVFFRVTGDKVSDISFRHIDEQTEEEHLIIEALRRDIAGNTASMNTEGDVSPLKSRRLAVKKSVHLRSETPFLTGQPQREQGELLCPAAHYSATVINPGSRYR